VRDRLDVRQQHRVEVGRITQSAERRPQAVPDRGRVVTEEVVGHEPELAVAAADEAIGERQRPVGGSWK
jgi:hypothetical protein